MRLAEFLTRVQDRGEYRSQEEAEHVSEAVLWTLATRITPEEADELAARLPAPRDEALHRDRGCAESFGRAPVCWATRRRNSSRPRTAEWDAGAVLSTVADSVSGGELEDLLARLPVTYAELFGRPEPG